MSNTVSIKRFQSNESQHDSGAKSHPPKQHCGLHLTLLGTGDAAGVPQYGCNCAACERARHDPRFKRRPSSALIESGGTRILIDAGLVDLAERFPAGTLSAILLTHYHVDHVQGLFHLRWGTEPRIDVFSPPDPDGCADLYKHSGLLAFQHLDAFLPLRVGHVTVIPVPLNHSKITFGYCLETSNVKIAYLCDTLGLGTDSLAFLKKWRPDCVVLDCSHPTSNEPPRNHNDLRSAVQSAAAIGAGQVIFTHVGHALDLWLLRHYKTLPSNILIGYDGLTVDLYEPASD